MSHAALRDVSVSQFLDAIAAPNPTPGGGTAAAITGATGTALLTMVAGLAKTRHQTGDEASGMAAARRLAGIRERLVALADADAAAFDQVMAAYRLPKSTDEEGHSQAGRQQALRAATEAPLDTWARRPKR